MKSKVFSLNSVELLAYQPNRYPFLMIDHVTKVKPGVFAEGYKNFTNKSNSIVNIFTSYVLDHRLHDISITQYHLIYLRSESIGPLI